MKLHREISTNKFMYKGAKTLNKYHQTDFRLIPFLLQNNVLNLSHGYSGNVTGVKLYLV